MTAPPFAFSEFCDHVEIGRELLDAPVAGQVGDRLAQRHDMVEVPRRPGEPGIHAGDRAPIGLAAPRQGRVAGVVGERVQLRADPDESRVERQDAAELVQLVEIIGERPGALLPHRLLQHLGGDKRVAVAVAADPRADLKERRDRLLEPLSAERVEFVLDRAVEARQLAEEGVVVIGEAVGDLVDHFQPRLAQHVGAPEDKDAAPELLLVERELGLVAVGAIALVQKLCDLELSCQRALAPDLGRMGGQHRAHQRAVEEGAEPLGLDARLAYPVKGEGERAGAGSRAGKRMRAIAADVMLVLGDVREMGEIAEGAHNRQGLVGAQAVEHRLELAPRADLVVAVEANGRLADLLDERVGLLALLLAHRVAQNATEQTDVVPQRAVFGVVGVGEGGFEGHRDAFVIKGAAAISRPSRSRQA